jgi:hypothetical protein
VLALLVAMVMLFGAAATAEATVITNWTGLQPSGTVTGSKPVIASGTGAFTGAPMSAATAKMYVDGVLIPAGTYTATARDVRSVYFYYSFQPQLSDGVHTFGVEMSDTAGALSSRTWGATVKIPPSATWLSPAQGAHLYDGRPQISLRLTDNTVPSTVTLAGQIRTGSATGPVVQTFGGTGLAQGTSTFTPASELSPGTYYLTATVTDAAGNVRSLQGASARSFTLVAAPGMSVLPTDCLTSGCHVRANHPATGMSCSSCHVVAYHENENCDDCHDAHTGPVSVTDVFGPCTACHSPAYPTVPAHTALNVDPKHGSSCDGCHVESLLARHSVAPEGSAYAYQCALCHASPDARVTAAVASGDASCSACHDSGHAALHDVTVPVSCGAVDCHAGTNLTTLHTGTCASCHESSDPVVTGAIDDGVKECAACHPND